MSDLSDLEDLVISSATLLLASSKSKKNRKARRFRINPYLQARQLKGRYFKDFSDLKTHPQAFKENFHMTPDNFDTLLTAIKPLIEPKRQSRPDSLTAVEKLAMTLEYLASGTILRHIGSVYRVSKQVVGVTIEQTCDAIYEALQRNYMKDISKENWIDVSNNFNEKWNLPNCLGAIDGKHVGIKCPSNAGSVFYNYKGFHSIVLMAVADADYRFLYIDVGAYGSEGDSSVFRESEFGCRLTADNLNLPPDAKVSGKYTPFYFVADDAFPLHKRILKPFAPRDKSNLLKEERIFNYRLSRARRCVENAFGVLCSKWLCLARTMFINPTRAQKVVAACCVLHNYLLKESSESYCPPGFGDKILADGSIVEGFWRSNMPPDTCFEQGMERQLSGRPSEVAKQVRKRIKEYVNSEEGSVAWQNNVI